MPPLWIKGHALRARLEVFGLWVGMGGGRMSENKCPCCGDTISIFTDSGFYECDSCPFMCALEDFPRIAAAMKAEAPHNALVEAVAWERECSSQDMCGVVADYAHHLYTRHGQDYLDEIQADFDGIIDAARAEVDRLIADCKEVG